jgi:hypothetical protein
MKIKKEWVEAVIKKNKDILMRLPSMTNEPFTAAGLAPIPLSASISTTSPEGKYIISANIILVAPPTVTVIAFPAEWFEPVLQLSLAA